MRLKPRSPTDGVGEDADVRREHFEALSRQLVRAVRGRRSQKGFSAFIGYRSNIAQRWEAGVCYPTAALFLRACVKVHPGVGRSFVEFFKRTPSWYQASEPFTKSSVSAFLRELRGKTPIGVLAQRAGYNRYSVGRWLQGGAEPRLPEFLALVEAASRRMVDFVATLVDPSRMPSLSARWAELQAARDVAYAHPWSHAVLRALELEGTRRGPGTQTARIALALGVEEAVVRAALEALDATGQVARSRGKWRATRVLAVDTSRDELRSRQLKEAWLQVAGERLRQGTPGTFGYSLFAVSRDDLRRLRELQLEYVRAMQDIIAESKSPECVGLYCSQLFDLGGEPARER